MGIFKKLFGGKEIVANVTTPENPARAAVQGHESKTISVFDGFGRELLLTRQAWRDSVLPGSIEKAWNDPDALASIVTQCLHDEFVEESIRPAQRLLELSPDMEGSAALLGVAYLKNHRLDDAERTLLEFTQRRGPSGIVMTNLAKVYAERDDNARSLETLWRGLQIDPNQENGVAWYEAIHREKEGQDAAQEALRRIAAIPGSWRPQLWIARRALQQRNLPEAMKLYSDALQRAAEPIPADLLIQMSGDLGNNGYLAELLELTEARYNVRQHGIQVGNNLIKSNVELGRLDPARRILDELYALQRPDWQQTLNYWDTEIARRRVENVVPAQSELEITMRVIDGPVWLGTDNPAANFFSHPHPDLGPIVFIGSSASLPDAGDHVRVQLSNGIGRLSRALPLFFSEQVYLHAISPVQTLIPWVVTAGSGGFVLSGVPWSDRDAVENAQKVAGNARFVVITHIAGTQFEWRVTVRLVRCEDAALIETFEATCTPEQPGIELQHLASSIVERVGREIGSLVEVAPMAYSVPQGGAFADYLLRLEQLLATRCDAMKRNNPTFLSGEREIIAGSIRLCAGQPANVTTRVLLARTLLAMKAVKPAAVEEHRDEVLLLQRQHPLGESANGVIEKMLDVALAIQP